MLGTLISTWAIGVALCVKFVLCDVTDSNSTPLLSLNDQGHPVCGPGIAHLPKGDLLLADQRQCIVQQENAQLKSHSNSRIRLRNFRTASNLIQNRNSLISIETGETPTQLVLLGTRLNLTADSILRVKSIPTEGAGFPDSSKLSVPSEWELELPEQMTVSGKAEVLLGGRGGYVGWGLKGPLSLSGESTIVTAGNRVTFNAPMTIESGRVEFLFRHRFSVDAPLRIGKGARLTLKGWFCQVSRPTELSEGVHVTVANGESWGNGLKCCAEPRSDVIKGEQTC